MRLSAQYCDQDLRLEPGEWRISQISSRPSCRAVSCDIEDQVQFVHLTNIVPIESRIIGGTPASIDQYPFAAQIIVRGYLTCGGSLLTLRNVLSAAHCFFDWNNNLIRTRDVRVRAGTSNNNSGGTRLRVSRIAIHERYNMPLRDNDIAILQTSSRFPRGSRIRLALIPFQNDVVPDNSPLIHIGWGITWVHGQQLSPYLRHVPVLKINREVCASRYQQLGVEQNSSFPVTENMMCAGLLDLGGAGACRGDRGGPLLFNRTIVVGVVSWGHDCAHPQYPGVNMRVARYSNWINATVANLNGSPSVSESRVILLFTLICAIIHWHSS
ncbi:trypsin CFT-1-like [Hyposmocoma kahamanoa]|uniref:trypsin CFT-1-like n=1 Tax=Hyposmocoma kahamanoa TaxID=1477025 RepID=UPI000E6D9433|nr:trypsin CFT-1-like [Hyposmocoma kahamanoa]